MGKSIYFVRIKGICGCVDSCNHRWDGRQVYAYSNKKTAKSACSQVYSRGNIIMLCYDTFKKMVGPMAENKVYGFELPKLKEVK